MTSIPKPSTIQRWLDDIQHELDHATADHTHPPNLHDPHCLRCLAGESARPLEEGPGLGHHDGYPPGGSTGRGSKGVHADPTFARANAHHVPDQTGSTVSDYYDQLRQMAKLARTARHLRGYATGAANETRGRVSSLQGICQCCRRDVPGTAEDKLVSGYCRACRKAWQREGYPDRVEFENQRRKTLAERDARRAANTPPRCATCNDEGGRYGNDGEWEPCPSCAERREGDAA